MLVTDQGKIIRTTVGDIRIAGRNTMGVTIFKVAQNEHVVGVAKIDLQSEAVGSRELDRVQMGERVADRRGHALAEAETAECLLGVAGDLLCQSGLGGQLVVVGQEACALGLILKSVQQHRLANPA